MGGEGGGGGGTRLTSSTNLYMKRGMVLRAFIIIRNYNHSIIIQAKTRTTSHSTFADVFNISQQQHPLSNKLKNCLLPCMSFFVCVFLICSLLFYFFISLFLCFLSCFFLLVFLTFGGLFVCLFIFVLFGWFLLFSPFFPTGVLSFLRGTGRSFL